MSIRRSSTLASQGSWAVERIWLALGIALLALAGTAVAKVGPDDQIDKAAIIAIHDEITDVTFASLKRRVDLAREAGVNLIVLEMDTPGGLVSSALDICTYLKNLSDIKVVAWVRPAAYSAGVMISLSCDEVVMVGASKMGDCAPIFISPTGGVDSLGETERAKAESPILKEFRDSADRHGYDRLMCESMVRMGNEIWWVENQETGEREFVLKAKKEELLKEDHSPWRLVATMTDPITGHEIDVKQPVVETNDLLTLTQTEAVNFGFAKAIVADETELRDYYHISGEITRISPTWSENLAEFLCSPIVRLILMALIAVGIYAESQAPGTLVGGCVAAAALAIFLGAPYLTGLANIWEILLVVVGLILIAIEIFVIPGFGFAGILGGILVIAAFVATFMPGEPGPSIIPRLESTWLGLQTGLKVVLGGMGLSLIGMWVLNKYLPKMPGTRGLFLSPPQVAADSVGAAATDACVSNKIVESPVRLGDVGDALTPLRPAGKALINGRRMDVITRGQMLDKDSRVEVIEVSGNHIVVREIETA